MSTTTEPYLRRLAYLHEAGHAVVALELNLQVIELLSDGDIGHCHPDFQAEADAALEQAAVVNSDGNRASVQTFQGVVDAYFPRLACTMGGIAGESLELGRPVYSARRPSNGFGNFFGYVAAMSRHLKPVQYMPIWNDAYQCAQDVAWEIVRKCARDVKNIADALEHSSPLTNAALLELI